MFQTEFLGSTKACRRILNFQQGQGQRCKTSGSLQLLKFLSCLQICNWMSCYNLWNWTYRCTRKRLELKLSLKLSLTLNWIWKMIYNLRKLQNELIKHWTLFGPIDWLVWKPTTGKHTTQCYSISTICMQHLKEQKDDDLKLQYQNR